jgi:hypothetical protein
MGLLLRVHSLSERQFNEQYDEEQLAGVKKSITSLNERETPKQQKSGDDPTGQGRRWSLTRLLLSPFRRRQPGKEQTYTNETLSLFYTSEEFSLFFYITNAGKLSVALSGKDTKTKLLEGLTKDPQLRADDDPSVMLEEQFPSEHHALLQASREDDGILFGQYHYHIAVGEAARTASIGRTEENAWSAEEQNGEAVPVHCHQHQPLGRGAVHLLEAQSDQHGSQLH